MEGQQQLNFFRAFFEATGGRNWERNRNWETYLIRGEGGSIGSLQGVTVSGDTRTVTKLELGANRLSGMTRSF